MAGTEPDCYRSGIRRRAWFSASTYRWFAWIVGGLVGLTILLAILIDTPLGHRAVSNYISSLMLDSGLRIGVGEIEGSLYGKAELHDLVLSDPQGEFLRVPVTELDWRPLNWIFGELDIRNVAMRRGRLDRLPSFNPSGPDKSVLPELNIRIDRFEIERLMVARDVAGEEREISFFVAAQKRGGTLRLDATGSLGGQDRLAMALVAEPNMDRFDVELDYAAPAGGLLAGLMGTDYDWTARATGDGSWAQWDGSISIDQAETQLAEFQLSNRSGLFRLTGNLRPNENLEGLIARVAGPSIAMSALGRFENRSFGGEFWLTTPSLRAEGRGGINLSSFGFDQFETSFTLLNPSLFKDWGEVEGAHAIATLNGALQALEVEHQVEIVRLTTEQVEFRGLRQAGVSHFDGEDWDIALETTADAVTTGIGGANAALAQAGISRAARVSERGFGSDSIGLNSPRLSASFTVDVDRLGSDLFVVGNVEAAAMATQGIDQVDANADFVLRSQSGEPWRLEADVTGNLVRVQNALVEAIVGRDLAFAGKLTAGKDAPFLLSGLRLAGEHLQMTMESWIQNGDVRFAGTGQHSRHGLLDFRGAIEDGRTTASIILDSPLPIADIENLEVALASIEGGFSIETNGTSVLGPFDGKLRLLWSGPRRTQFTVDQLDIWKTRVSGELALDDGFVLGTLDLSGGGLSGSAMLFRQENDTQAYAAEISATNAHFEGNIPISVARATIDANGNFGGTFQSTAEAQGVSYGQLHLSRVLFESGFVGGRGTVNASISHARNADLALQVRANVESGQAMIAAQGRYGEGRISMPRRARIEWAEGRGWTLHRSQLNFEDGFLIAEAGTDAAGNLQGRLSLSDFQVAIADAVLPDSGIRGTASGQIEWAWNSSTSPTATMRLNVEDFGRFGFIIASQPLDLALDAELSARQLRMSAVTRDGGRQIGRMSFRISNLPASGSLFDRLNAGALMGELQFDGPAASIWRLAAIDAFDVTGPVALQVMVGGSLSDPVMRGGLRGEGLRVHNILTGIDIRNLTVRSEFSGSLLKIDQFSGTTGNEGSISGNGTVDFADSLAHGPKIDIKFVANRARLVERAEIAATVSGPMRVYSDGFNGTIAGRLRIEQANWDLGNADPAEALPLLETKEAHVTPEQDPAVESGTAWTYMIDAEADDDISVEGLGLQSEWSADIRLRGAVDDLRIGGQAVLRRGDFSFAGTTLNIEYGRITFDETGDPDPVLDILAESYVEDLEVQVTVVGNASAPTINFRSLPSLPEEELISRLLFGGGISGLTAVSALQIGAAVSALDSGGGLGPINNLRRATGLDRLKLLAPDPSIDRGTAIAVGEHLTDRLYVELVTDGQRYSATQFEFRLTHWLLLLATTSSIRRDRAGIAYRKDY